MRATVRILGPVLAAALVVGALGAGEASASVLMTEGNVPATLFGEQTAGEPLVFTGGTGENQGKGVCSSAKFTTKLATSPASEVTIAPEFGGCEFKIQAVDTNTTGCGYRAYGFTATKIDTFHGPVDLVCPFGKQIDTSITVAGKTVCILTSLPKKNAGQAEITDITPGLVLLTFQLTSLNLKFDSITPNGCFGESSEIEMENGTLNGSLTISATNESAESLPLTME